MSSLALSRNDIIFHYKFLLAKAVSNDKKRYERQPCYMLNTTGSVLWQIVFQKHDFWSDLKAHGPGQSSGGWVILLPPGGQSAILDLQSL